MNALALALFPIGGMIVAVLMIVLLTIITFGSGVPSMDLGIGRLISRGMFAGIVIMIAGFVIRIAEGRP